MSRISDEILTYLGCSEWDEEKLEHYGMPRRSGRYPWGSGKDPYQHGSGDFLARVEELRKSNFTYTDGKGKKYTGDTAIAKSMGLSTSQFRTEIGLAKDERRMLLVATAKSLKDDGLNNSEIGRRMGINESSVRSLLNPNSESKMMQAKKTAEFIKKQVDEKGMIDIGTGADKELRISKEKLNQALYLLEREGYPIYKGGVPQVTNPGQQTNQRVICRPGTPHKDIYQYDKVHPLNEDKYISRDGGDTFEKRFHYPASLDSKRLMVRYKEDGGIDKDGVIELRRGLDDLSLGESRYSQVRILVDNDRYLKGMAVYSDNMPKGVDVIFNTNKTKDVSKMDVLKKIKDDPDNPFGSAIKDSEQGGQYWYTDKKTGERKLGLINKTREEGDWNEWKDNLPSQFLSKQSLTLAKKQLGLAQKEREAEFDSISSLTNPTVKKHLLEKFADECDSAAKDLKAAALPGQKYHVILPVNSLKETEIFAPNYKDGTKLALIRYPHGGTFEIPILTVNNKHTPAKKLIGLDSIDAVGINSKVAERLSGADFDGDTVMCIPTHDRRGRVKISSRDPLKGLEGFDPKMEYPERAGMKYMTKKGTQTEMGMISNLITDMTLAGAEDGDLAKAVRHSMVVIDAEKHKLDYKKSEIDNNIVALNKKYRTYIDDNGVERYARGASTIISKAKGEKDIKKRQGTPKINQIGKDWYDPSKPEGALIYKEADDLYYPIRKYNKTTGEVTYTTTNGKKITYKINDTKTRNKYEPVEKIDPKTGETIFTNKSGDITYKTKFRTQKSTWMAETDDAMTLVSQARHPMEIAYAEYANSMKALANKARKDMIYTGKIAYSASAKKTYATEVKSLKEKLDNALLNAPKERAAQRLANAEVNAKKIANPNMDNEEIRKASQRALNKYRNELGSVARRERNIDITDKEWEAIQAGAISEAQLKKILDNTDISKLRQLATPRASKELSSAQIARIKAYNISNYTLEQIAKKMGVSTSTVSKYLKSN